MNAFKQAKAWSELCLSIVLRAG